LIKTLSVLIPSRERLGQNAFLYKALSSIRAQVGLDKFKVSVIIAIDRGKSLPLDVTNELVVKVVNSEGFSQAAALNAAVTAVDSEFVAILEDDDQWQPHYLETTLMGLERAAFVSSTQLEIDEDNNVVRINDFPTPSGWFMTSDVLEKIGLFNTDYRWHLDNEWLGRLNQSGVQRMHFVESTAPIKAENMFCRPHLEQLIRNTKGLVLLGRHSHPVPLVKRLVHRLSGLMHVATDKNAFAESQIEYKNLIHRFGVIPW